MARDTVRVALGSRAYDVVVADAFEGFGEALVAATGRRPAIVVADAGVPARWPDAACAALEAAGVAVTRLGVTAGEAGKDVETWWSIVDGLLTAGVDRRTPVVAVGGGVLGDLVGFAAAATLRGLPFVQVPTTLLAMVDSSVGGKTGFNHPRGKNLVGAFHQPVLVWAALATLSTLPPEELRAGLGEVVKTALIGDAALLGRLEVEAGRLASGDPEVLAPVIARCVAIKAEVVAADEREAGWRAVLNAGHTVGHGIEAATGFGAWRHGEAVAAGLVLETAWAEREGVCVEPGLSARLARLLERMGLPTGLPAVPRDRVVAAMGVDKKADADRLTLPVPERAGRFRLVQLPRHRLSELVPA